MKRHILLCLALMLTFSFSCANTPKSYPLEATQPNDTLAPLRSIPTDVAPADAFNAVAAQYKGQIAFIDLWATWCGPCRQAMNFIKDIKPGLQTRGVKFVYITGETSPQDAFKEMYPAIHGDHFYLTDAQFRGIIDQFRVEGVPHYILINKAGQVVWQHTGYPGNDEVKSQIDALLAQ